MEDVIPYIELVPRTLPLPLSVFRDVLGLLTPWCSSIAFAARPDEVLRVIASVVVRVHRPVAVFVPIDERVFIALEIA